MRNVFCLFAALGVVAGAMAQCPNPTNGNRASVSQKGSLLIFPKVRVVLEADSPKIIEDTFIQISNDFNSSGVHVLTYFVCGTNCFKLYTDIDLTKNQPIYWSAATGKAGNLPVVAPITSTPGCVKIVDGKRVYEGYYFMFAANDDNEQIRWNHLTGVATRVNYDAHTACEYSAYAFAALTGANGDPIGTPGTLNLDGVEYESGFNRLLLEFITVGSMAFSGGGKMVDHDTELTLMINDIDVRQEKVDFYTKAQVNLWNQDEASFATEYCIPCWDCSKLSQLGPAFSLPVLGFDRARAAIDGIPSPVVCDDPPTIITAEHALLGVASKILKFSNGNVATACTQLVGTGQQCATVKYDVPDPIEEGVVAPLFKAPTR